MARAWMSRIRQRTSGSSDGPARSRREGGGAFPQLRLVALSETGTHAICAAALGPLSSSENVLADELLGAA